MDKYMVALGESLLMKIMDKKEKEENNMIK